MAVQNNQPQSSVLLFPAVVLSHISKASPAHGVTSQPNLQFPSTCSLYPTTMSTAQTQVWPHCMAVVQAAFRQTDLGNRLWKPDWQYVDRDFWSPRKLVGMLIRGGVVGSKWNVGCWSLVLFHSGKGMTWGAEQARGREPILPRLKGSTNH